MAKILIVEDDASLSQTYSDFLKNERHQVFVAHDGQDGINKFSNSRFDLLILDLKIPKLTGQKIIEQLFHSVTGDLPCPIVISSGFIDSEIIKKYSSHKKIHFLPKPTSKKEFLTTINRLLSRQPIPKIDVSFINPILESTIDVIKQMTNFDVTVGKPETKWAGEISGDISAVVGIVSSGFKGTISISFQEPGFLNIVKVLLGEEATSINDENKDAVAEILNIIFGQTKKKLNEIGYNIQPAIPAIVLGKSHSIEHQTELSTVVIPFHSPGIGNFRIEFSVTGS